MTFVPIIGLVFLCFMKTIRSLPKPTFIISGKSMADGDSSSISSTSVSAMTANFRLTGYFKAKTASGLNAEKADTSIILSIAHASSSTE